jgi:hypothetical protein
MENLSFIQVNLLSLDPRKFPRNYGYCLDRARVAVLKPSRLGVDTESIPQ